jgi:hypothetical protein
MPDQSSAATEHAILAEITRPLEALPEDPLAYVDADFPMALRGYDRVAVDEYVRETRRLVAELQATRSPEAAVRRALERVGEQISGILQRAHETAEQITAQSRSEAEDRLEQARLEAAQITNAAEQRVKDLDADTDRIWLERQRIVADAEDLAAQLLALARTAGDRFAAEAEAETAAMAAFDAADAGDEVDPAAAVEDIEGDPAPEGRVEPAMTAELEGEVEPAMTAGLEGEVEPAMTAGLEGDEETVVAAQREGEEPDLRSEVEKTVAFQPLEAPEARTPGDQAPAEDPGPADRSSAHPGSTEDDDTAVIPPASQAANRRANQ